MAQPLLRVIAAALARLLAGVAVCAGLLLVAQPWHATAQGRALVLLAFAGLGAGIFASERTLLRGRGSAVRSRKAPDLSPSKRKTALLQKERPSL